MKELNSILKIKETDKRLDNIESNFIEADYKVLEGEQLIANTNDGYTKDIKISGQSVLNVAPIKGPVDITAELSGTGTDITFENTSEGYVNGVTIKGKTYQNLITGLSGFHSSHTIITSIENKGSVTLSASDTNVNQAIWPSFLCDMNLSYSLDKNRLYTLFYRSEKADNTFGFIASDNIATPETYSNLQNKSIAGLNVALIDLSNFKTVERFRLRVFDITDNLKRRFVWSNIMILEGDHTANTDINEYFEGIAGVGDKEKNLFDKNDVIMDSRVSEVSGSILSGFPDTIVSGISKVKPSKNYVIDGRGSYSGVYAYGKNMEYIKDISSSSSFTAPDNAYFVRFHIELSQDLNRVQLVEGTASTPYEEYYDGVAVEVKSRGKNLCPTKSHDVVFATTGQSQNSNKSLIAKDIKITPGKEYCLSSNKFFGVGFIKIITHSTAFGESVTNHESAYTSSLRVREISPTHVSGSFIAGTNENYISLTTGNWLLDSANNSWSFDNIQLEEGTTITPYEPYKEHKVKTILQSPLMSLPNGVCDEIIGDTVIRRVGKIILDGNEDWYIAKEETIVTRFYIMNTPNLRFGNGTSAQFSDKFIYESDYSFDNEAVSPYHTDARLYIKILKSRLSTQTVAGLKTWLAANPTTVYYELATPVIVPIIDKKECVVLPNGIVDRWSEDKLVRNVGKVILDGSEEWELNTTPNQVNTLSFLFKAYDNPKFEGTDAIKGELGNHIKLDGFNTIASGPNFNSNDSEMSGLIGTRPTIGLRILKSKLATPDVEGFKKWLSENNTTVWYELATPEVTNIKKEQFKLKTYSTRTSISTNTVITPELNINSIGLRKKALIKPETKYQFKFKRASGTNPITVDLGGAKKVLTNESTVMITTPATLFHEELRISGYNVKVENIMTTEGESSCDYTDGIWSVGNKGKNLFNKNDVIRNKYIDTNNGTIVDTTYKLGVFEIDVRGLSSIIYSGIKNATELVTQSSGGRQTYLFKNNKGLLFGSKFTSDNKADTTIVIPSNAESLIITVCLETMHLIQLEEGTIATPYEEYYDGVNVEVMSCRKNLFDIEKIAKSPYTPQESDTLKLRLPEPLRSVPSGVSDTIEKTNGEWVVARRCDEVILDESKDWKYHSSKESLGLHRYILDFNKMKTSHDNSSNIYCNNLNIGIDNSEAEIWIDKTITTRKDINREAFYIISQIGEPTKFKQWLSENPTTVIYELAQPTMHPLNTLQLPNGISDEIKNGKLIKKISKIVFDGSQEWGYSSFNTETKDFVVFYHNESMGYNGCINSIKEGYLCNSFESETPEFTSIGDLFATKECISGDTTKKELRLSIQKSKLLTADISGLNKWLLENPITVYYELDNKIELDYKSEDLNLKTYKDTTHFYSNTNVNPDLAIKLLENDNLSTSVKNLYDYIARLEKQVSILTKNGVLFE